MVKQKSPKIVTKKHLARLERERRQIRIITGVAIAIVAVIFLGILYGVLEQTILFNYLPIVTVNHQTVYTREFELRVRVARQELIDQYMQDIEMAQMFGIDPTTDTSLSSELSNIEDELSLPSTIGNQVLTEVEDNLLIRQYAAKHSITVSSAEVDQAIQAAYQYYPNGTPTLTLTPTSFFYSTLSSNQIALISPTPTLTSTPTGTPAPTDTPASTGTPGPSPTPLPTETPLPSSTPITAAGFQSLYNQGLNYYNQYGMTEAEYRQIFFEDSLYQQKVEKLVTANIKQSQDEVWARQILVANEATAMTVRQLLVAGADWNVIANKYSIDTATKTIGGNLGWFGRGVMLPQFEAAAFSLKIGEISQPVKTTDGYHIIQVLGHEIRPLTSSDYQTAVTNAFNTWLTDQQNASKIVVDKSWLSRVPSDPALDQALANYDATQTAYAPTNEAQALEYYETLTAQATPLPVVSATPTP
jgi:parvulin-like peptidyl-prolyl isomerase